MQKSDWDHMIRTAVGMAREILLSELTLAFDSTAEHAEAMLDDILEKCR